MVGRDRIQKELSAIKKQMEDCLQRLNSILEMHTEINDEDEELSGTKAIEWRCTTLKRGKAKDFRFNMSFSAKFIRTKSL